MTLVEMIVALLIFAAVFSSGVACLRLGLNQIDNARNETRAAQIMQSEIERLRSEPWNNIRALTGGQEDIEIGNDFAETQGYDIFSLKRQVSGGGDTRRIELKVKWTDLNGKPHSKIYVAQYTKGGLYDYIQ